MSKHYVAIVGLLVTAGVVLFIYQSNQKTTETPELTVNPSSSGIISPIILPKYGIFTLPMFGYAELNARWSVQFVKVYEDSRCPTGVACFQAGRAIVGIQLLDKNTTTNRAYVEKVTVGSEPIEMAFKAEDGASIRVQITAKDLLPYPKAEAQPNPVYFLILQIKQLPY